MIRKPDPESGYALLLVFAMASIVAITLYTQVPRVAFEAQRDQEDLLMSRGHEYIRAITLFVHKFNRFPASMDELENTNNIRFLRRQYKDPMTGKTDWRLLHAGPGGVITDSINSAKKTDAKTQQNFITEMQMFGVTPAGDSEGNVNLATRRRASDQPGAGGETSYADNSSPNSGNPPPLMVLPDGSIVPANSSGTAPLTPPVPPPPGAPPALLGAPGATGPNAPAMPGQQTAQNTPPLPSQFAPGNAATNLINQLLTSPRPGGLYGLPGGQTPVPAGVIPPTPTAAAPTASVTTTAGAATPAGQQVIGAGLAGVASKREQQGIKSYNQHTKYNEWEFVYDISKDPTKTAQAPTGAAGATGATGAQGSTGATSQPPPILPATGLTSTPMGTGAPP